jgi:hypothetical protein
VCVCVCCARAWLCNGGKPSIIASAFVDGCSSITSRCASVCLAPCCTLSHRVMRKLSAMY